MIFFREILVRYYNTLEKKRVEFPPLNCCSEINNRLQQSKNTLIYDWQLDAYGFLISKTEGYIVMSFCILCGNPTKKKIKKIVYQYFTIHGFHKKILRTACLCTNGKNINTFCNSEILYNTRFREYGIKQVRKRGPYIIMKYCLWCGRQFKESLKDLWTKLLQNNYNITDPLAVPLSSLPKSFRSDEWWKRRGL